MEKFFGNDRYTLYHGNMLNLEQDILPESIDSIVTDPPYELGFMGKSWDSQGVAFQADTWKKCFNALKPGGYLLAFGGSRTFHIIACAIEDAGFEIRDTIMWLYGCLSEDTEVLTRRGFKNFFEVTEEDEIRVYDIESGIYKWEKPQRWNVYKTEQDTCYRIKSDRTDQLVSRNHRCLIERDGKIVFEFAENLCDLERVPVLSYDIPYIQESNGVILFTDLLWQNEELVKELFKQQFGKEKSQESTLWRKEPILERWGDLSGQKRKLLIAENKICSLSREIQSDGKERWVRNGTSTISSPANKQTTIENRSCSSQESQCRRQQTGEFDAVFNEQRAQTIREWKTYTTTLATITKEKYTGIVFCPTVTTGCFVARRNGKIFITGNSGFPKSMNIGKAVLKDIESELKKQGVENIEWE